MIFELNENEIKKFHKWKIKHNKNCSIKNAGAIGGKFTFSFTPTGLGCITKITCGCGKEIVVTNFNEW